MARLFPADGQQPGAVASLSDVSALLRRSREHLDRGAADQGGSGIDECAARRRLWRFCRALHDLPTDRRLARRSSRTAPHARHRRVDRLPGDGADGDGRQLASPLQCAAPPRHRRGRGVSDRNAGDVVMDAAGAVGLRARHHALRGPDRQRADAAAHRFPHRAGDVARLVRRARRGEPRLGGGVGVVLPRRSAPAPGDDARGTGADSGAARRGAGASVGRACGALVSPRPAHPAGDFSSISATAGRCGCS